MRHELPHAYPDLQLQGTIRQFPMDFQVVETLSFELTGAGEHVYLQIRKQLCNTHDIAVMLAQLANVPVQHIGFAGRKDKVAVTTQWFSVYLSNRPEPDWHAIENENIEIHSIIRHDKKCRIGALIGNTFKLCIRDIDLTKSGWELRLQQLKESGFPNYFGEQRFGHQGNNLDLAKRYFDNPRKVRDRTKRSFAISAARSFLFNEILARRVEEGIWSKVLPGDVAMLKSSHSVFHAELSDVERLDINPCASLFGIDNNLQSGAPKVLEEQVIAEHECYQKGLIKQNIKRHWRSLVAMPLDLTWYPQGDTSLILEFKLQEGQFATTFLRELMAVKTFKMSHTPSTLTTSPE